MNKYLLVTSFFGLLSVAQVASAQVKGNGNVVTRERPAGSFNQIHTHGSFDVVVTDGDNHKVDVEAEENIQEFIVVETKGNTLVIQSKKGQQFRATKQITIHVTAPALTEIKTSGSGNVKSTNTLTGSTKFQIKSSGSGNAQLEVESDYISAGISGSGNITLKGKTKELEGSIAGSGNIKARELHSEVTSVKISGSGNAEVVATQKLNSKIAGSGDVRYWGDASVDSKIAGSGSVRKEK